jgi:hypothetical protein
MAQVTAVSSGKGAPGSQQTEPASKRRVATEVLAWVALAAALLASVPLFLRLGVWGDTALFDLAARSLVRRGHCYRDMFFHGPPGMIWCQLVVRCLVGWGSVALRAADLLILSGVVWLLARGVQPRGLPRAASVWIAATLYLSYFSGTEWAHCQSDGWMLLPALGALFLRQRQAAALADAAVSPRALVGRSLAEGVLWGVAFLIKPYVALSAVPCLLLTSVATLQTVRGGGAIRRLAADGAGVLSGGLLVGAASVAALYLTGDWHDFLAATLGGWNKDYTGQSLDWGERTKNALLGWQYPWKLVLYPVATPLACWLVVVALRNRPNPADADATGRARLPLLAAFFLGWFFQSNYLQKQFEYQVLPDLLLAWALVLGWFSRLSPRAAVIAVLPAAALTAAVFNPLLTADRLRLWRDCWTSPDSDRLKDELALNKSVGNPPWYEFRGVVDYLKEHRAKDREVTCWNFSTIAVFTETGLEPPCRFVFPGSQLDFFPSFQKTIVEETVNSPQRYVVVDQGAISLDPRQMKLLLKVYDPTRTVQVYHSPSERFVILRVPPREGRAGGPG